jgi:type IV pilus assembly protein PilZ
MKVLEARFGSAAEFLNCYIPEIRNLDGAPSGRSGFFVTNWMPIVEGSRVALDISVTSVMERCCLEGVVTDASSTLQVGGRELRGIRVDFDADERTSIDQFLAQIDHDLTPFASREIARSALRMEVESDELSRDGKPLLASDFGPGGLFVRTRKAPAVGGMVQMRLVAPDYTLDRVVVGEVAWHGYKGEDPGVGVRFVFTSAREKRQWRSIFARLQRTRQRRATEAALKSAQLDA